MIKYLILKLIRFYQVAISPLMAPRCRYYPSCSAYARQAVLWHGTVRGLPLVIRRILSCHPWGGSGVDFVPLPLYRYRFVLADACPPWVLADRYSYGFHLNRLMKL